MTVKEVTIKVKDAQKRKHQHHHLVYDDFTLSDSDPTIMQLVRELKESIKEQLDEPEFTVSVKMVL